jgi:hypothetical protein
MTDFEPVQSMHTKVLPVHVHAVGVAGVLALGGLAYAFGVMPSLQAEAQARSQHEAIARAGERVRAAKAALATAEARLGSLREAGSAEPIPSEKLVGHLTEVATGFGLTILGADRSGTERVDGLARTQLTVNAMGSFSDIDAFVSQFQDHLPTAEIEGFAIVPSPTDAERLALMATVLVHAPQPSATDAATTTPAGSAPSAAAPDR